MVNDFVDKIEAGWHAFKKMPLLSYQYNPRKLVYELNKLKLYHYEAQVKKPQSIPLLMVFATVNRPEILDLRPDQSFIGELLKNGLDVYLLDWGFPDENDNNMPFEDYVLTYLNKTIHFIQKKNKKEKINLLGVCQGGVISLSYAALFQTIKNLVLISTPIHFHTKNNLIAKLLHHVNVMTLANHNQTISGKLLTQFFISLRPFELLGKKYLRFIDNLENAQATETFLYVEKWLHDTPDQPSKAFSQFIDSFYRQNQLIKDEIKLDGTTVRLKNLTMPILNIMGSRDEIVPVSASKVLKQYVGTKDYHARIFKAGHIGIYLNNEIAANLAKTIANWLIKRESN